jgi:hypothetical protein
MPEISCFYGIVIRMYFGDHNPPHFHAEYGEDRATISIATLGLLDGRLPPRIMGMVAEWAALHQDELMTQWQRAINMEPLGRIEPLA